MKFNYGLIVGSSTGSLFILILTMVLLAATVNLAYSYPEPLISSSSSSSSSSTVAPSSEVKQCAGGYREGDRVDRGRYWYVCQNGQLMPKGCFSNDYTRLNVHESYHSDGYAISCVFDENGYLGFAYKACVHQGVEYFANNTWEELGLYWYTCVQEGDSLRTEMSGCIHENKRLKTMDTIDKGDFIYQCRRYANNTCNMTPVGCIHGGQRYNVGDSIEQGKYWYACTIEDGEILKKCVGCMYEQQRLQDGDRYTSKDAVFECTIRKGDDPDHRLVGCMDLDNGTIIERRLGCQWVRGSPPYQYVMQCVKDGQHRGVVKKAVHCFYRVGKGGYEVKPGCFKTDGQSLIIACHVMDNTGSAINLETYPISQLKEVYLKGLRFC